MGALTSSTVEYYTLSTFYETFSHTNPVCMNSDASRPIRASVVPMLHGKNKHGPMSRTTGMLCSLAILLSCIRICCSCTALHKAEQPELVVLSQPAFCTALDSECRGTVDGSVPDISIKNATHPSPIPEEIHLPWIWDAVLNPERSFVELTVVSPSACEFEHAKWKHAVDSFPQYKDQLADGTLKNVLLHSPGREVFDFIGSKYPVQGIMGKTLTCVFYKKKNLTNSEGGSTRGCINGGESVLVARTQSYPVQGHSTYFSIGTVQIRCPLPQKLINITETREWDMIALERDVKELANSMTEYSRTSRSSTAMSSATSASNFSLADIPSSAVPRLPALINSTHPVPVVCSVPAHVPVGEPNSRSLNSNDSWDSEPQYRYRFQFKRRYRYGLSACTATGRLSRAYLTEWVEYHRMLGVEHFFIYNTATADRKQDEMAHMLRHYVTERVVTLVRWPYANCARNMSSGRMTYFSIGNTAYSFQPPRPIAQSAALASCYTRFRHSSRYITHIDDDEFISISPYEILRNEKTIRNMSKNKMTVQRIKRRMALDVVLLGSIAKIRQRIGSNTSMSNPITSNRVGEVPGSTKEIKSTFDSHINIKHFADLMFSQNPESAVISLRPVDMTLHCSANANASVVQAAINYPFLFTTQQQQKQVQQQGFHRGNDFQPPLLLPPPRVGNWMYGRLGERSNPKLILHTERAGMFHIHYLSMLEQPHRWFDDVILQLVTRDRQEQQKKGTSLSDSEIRRVIDESLRADYGMQYSGTAPDRSGSADLGSNLHDSALVGGERSASGARDMRDGFGRIRGEAWKLGADGMRKVAYEIDNEQLSRRIKISRYPSPDGKSVLRGGGGRRSTGKDRKMRFGQFRDRTKIYPEENSKFGDDVVLLERFSTIAAPYAQALSDYLLPKATLHLPVSRAAVLHYRDPAFVTGNIFGARLPIGKQGHGCAGSRVLSFSAEIVVTSRRSLEAAPLRGRRKTRMNSADTCDECAYCSPGLNGCDERDRSLRCTNLSSENPWSMGRRVQQRSNDRATEGTKGRKRERFERGASLAWSMALKAEFTHHLLTREEMLLLAERYTESMIRS